jgi:hypothetical protein
MPNSISITDKKSVNDLFNSILDRLDSLESKKRGTKKRTLPESIEEVKAFFKEYGFSEELAEKFWKSYSVNNWCDGKNNPVVNWKQKAINVWFKPEDKIDAKATTKTSGPSKSRSAVEQQLLLEQLRQSPDTYSTPEEILNLDTRNAVKGEL